MKNTFINDDKKMAKKSKKDHHHQKDHHHHECRKKKVLFVLKKKNAYGNPTSAPYGLKTSCYLVSECLKPYANCKIVEVIDGNSINKEIYDFRPDFVIIEAIWCPPYKIRELIRLYPKTQFSIRLHSKFPFLAQEKLALEWMNEYRDFINKYDNLSISANNEDFIYQINNTLNYAVELLPNCYPIDDSIKQDKRPVGEILDIGCFGALRILKNQLQQAICAIYQADQMKKNLRFHINDSSTLEKEGRPILNNLTNLFKGLKHELIIHTWQDHDSFIDLIKSMDIGMQVSFSESYDIIAADFCSNGIPIIGSKEIEFLSSSYQADPNDFYGIVNKLRFAISNKWLGLHRVNELRLRNNTKRAVKIWLKYLDINQ